MLTGALASVTFLQQKNRTTNGSTVRGNLGDKLDLMCNISPGLRLCRYTLLHEILASR